MLEREVKLRIFARKAIVATLTNVIEVEVSVVVEFVHARKTNVASMRFVHNLRDSVIGAGSASPSRENKRERWKTGESRLTSNPTIPSTPFNPVTNQS